MTTEAFQTFTALLALFALVITVAVVGVRVVARRSPSAAYRVDELRAVAPYVAAIIAIAAMLGSLYFSEVADYVPCTLCWYQRIAMYSSAVVLTVAALRRDRSVSLYVLILAVIGAAISTYHWLLERFPDLDAGACSVVIPCEHVWFEEFGFVTLPFMALCGFLAIIALTSLSLDRSIAGRAAAQEE